MSTIWKKNTSKTIVFRLIWQFNDDYKLWKWGGQIDNWQEWIVADEKWKKNESECYEIIMTKKMTWILTRFMIDSTTIGWSD